MAKRIINSKSTMSVTNLMSDYNKHRKVVKNCSKFKPRVRNINARSSVETEVKER